MMGDWTFFSNYGHVLVCLSRNNQARLRDVAQEVGITERAVQKIVRDLQDAGFIAIRKQGRCNRYRINRRKAMRHALESHVTVGKLLALVASPGRRVPVDREPLPAAETTQEPESGTKADKEAPAKPEPAKQPDTAPEEKGPIDVRQQGSLF